LGLKKLAKEHNLPLVITNDIHYVKAEDDQAQDILLCIQTKHKQADKDRMTYLGENFSMLSEAEGDNTDGLVEVANTQVDFFTSTKDWEINNSIPAVEYSYESLSEIAGSKDDLGGQLPTGNGVYETEENLTIDSGKIPSGYSSADFSNIIFVDGDLRIETNIIVNEESADLFVVSGNVEIEKTVTKINCGIFTDRTFSTAYNIVEGDDTPARILKGIYTANRFAFQRTLQGVDNNDLPSEEFIYEPKYITKLRDYIGINTVRWLSSE